MIAVTGATGHIGNVLVRQLLDRGQTLRAVLPPGEDTAPLEGLNLEIVFADIRDLSSLIRAFSGVEIVYHLAGVISILPGQRKLLEAVNVQGTRNVIEACRIDGVKRLVYTSSIHAVRESPRGIAITESQPFDPANVLGDYAWSKALATLEIAEGVRKGLDAVIVCPTGVIGPFDFKVSEMGRLMLDFISRRLKAYINGAYDFVDVRDVARGQILACEKGRTGESYILSGQHITIPDFLAALEKFSGVKAPALRLPSWVARGAGILATPYYLLSRQKPLFTAYSVDVLYSNSLVSSEKARRDLGYSARPVIESIADSISWWMERVRRQGIIGKMSSSLKPV